MLAVDYTVYDATPLDGWQVACQMRKSDIDEIDAATGRLPHEAMARAIEVSENSRMGRANGEAVCLFGVYRYTQLSNVGSIWMVGTDLLPRHSKAFLRRNAEEINRMTQGLVKVENWCDSRNRLTLRWLKWLGFTIEEPKPYGIKGLPFHHFWREQHV